MAKKKNYMTLFLAYCRRHEIWFSVCIDSSIDQITYLADGFDETIEPILNQKLGSKGCYEWIKREIDQIKENSKPGLMLRR